MRTVLSDNLSWQTDTCNVYLCEEGLAIRVDCESDCVYVYRTTKSRGLMQIVFIDRLEIRLKHIIELQYLSPLLTMLNFFISPQDPSKFPGINRSCVAYYQ